MAGWSRRAALRVRQPRHRPLLADWALQMAREYELRAIFAPQEPTLAVLAERYDELEAAGVGMTFPRAEILEQAFDKRLTLAAARRVGMPLPTTIATSSSEEVERAAAEIGYPVVIKAPRSYERRGAGFVRLGGPFYASSADAARAVARSLSPRDPPPLVQRFVEGTGIGMSMLLDREGHLRAEFAHRRLRDIDPRGSASVLREGIPVDPRLRDLSLELLREMGWWGVAMVELRIDEASGEFALMEVNGRFWGSLQLAIDSGVDFPELLLRVAEGDLPTQPSPAHGRRLRWWLGDMASTARVLKGRPPGFPGQFPSRWDALTTFAIPRRGTRNEVLRWSDPLPAAIELLGLLPGPRRR